MRLHEDLPKDYGQAIWGMPTFDGEKLTKRGMNGLENTLYIYSDVASRIADAADNNPENFSVQNISVVGSAARENKVDSDLDFLLIVPGISEQVSKDIKVFMSYVLFCDRDKHEAIDVFIRDSDAYPERSHIDITEQVRSLMTKYNNILRKK